MTFGDTVPDICVVGLGNMGTAFASTVAQFEWGVVAWNRNPARETPPGVRRVTNLHEAILDAPLVLVILLDHSVCTEVFSQPDVISALDGRTVINFTTSTPEEARQFGELMGNAGARVLSGVIPAYPADIGNADTGLILSGDESLWQRTSAVLRVLGPKSWWAGTDLGAAPALDLAMVGAFYHTAWGAFLEAMAYAESHGVSHEHSAQLGRAMTELLASSIDLSLEQVGKGDFSTDQATVDVHLAALDLIADSMSELAAGRKLALASIENDLRVAQARGLGDRSLSVIYGQLIDPTFRGTTSDS
jgi:3-hydroxyisobutyrate dehydrogenase-like beta-hydroxyacid dehydrogenase